MKFLLVIILFFFIPSNEFEKEFQNELQQTTFYPTFNSIYWTKNTDFSLFRKIDESTFKKIFRTETGEIYSWNQNSEVSFYILGFLKFEDGYTGVIVCNEQKFLGRNNESMIHYNSDLCFFDKNGKLGANHEFSSAMFQNDTLLWGGYSIIDTVDNSLTYYSKVSKENPYTNDENLEIDFFNFQSFDENWKTVDLILEN